MLSVQRRLNKSFLKRSVVYALASALILSFVFPSFVLAGAPSEDEKADLPVPITLFPSEGDSYTKIARPIITGQTQNNTAIEVYIDGVFVGMAKVRNGDLYTAYFSFQVVNPLFSGNHEVQVVAISSWNPEITRKSEVMPFFVEPNPAPTLDVKDLAVAEFVVNDSVIIKGITRNDTSVRLYIDGEVKHEQEPVNQETGVASFFFQAAGLLQQGNREIYVTALNSEGKESYPSEKLHLNVVPFTPAPADLKVMLPTGSDRPIVAGLVKNGLTVKISAADYGEEIISPNPDKSGVASFNHQMIKPMAVGKHILAVHTIDRTGKASRTSNIEAVIPERIIEKVTVLGESTEEVGREEAAGEEPVLEEELTEVIAEEGVVSLEPPIFEETGSDGNGEKLRVDEVESTEDDEESRAKRQRNIVIALLILIIVVAAFIGNRKSSNDDSGDGDEKKKGGDDSQKSLWNDDKKSDKKDS